jgi:hypothetical protein
MDPSLTIWWERGCAMDKEKLIKDDKNFPVYLNKYGEKARAHRESLYCFFEDFLIKLNAFTYNMQNEAYDQVGFLLEAIVDAQYKRLEAFTDLVKEHVGEIEIDTLQRGSNGYDGCPIGLVFKPLDEEKDGIS